MLYIMSIQLIVLSLLTAGVLLILERKKYRGIVFWCLSRTRYHAVFNGRRTEIPSKNTGRKISWQNEPNEICPTFLLLFAQLFQTFCNFLWVDSGCPLKGIERKDSLRTLCHKCNVGISSISFLWLIDWSFSTAPARYCAQTQTRQQLSTKNTEDSTNI